MTWEAVGAWLLWLCGPGILIWRRVSYAACYGYGRLLMTQAGQPDADEKECFARGRTELMSNAASAVMRLQPADVLARLGMLWAGLVFWRNQMRERRLRLWAGLWAGLKHDLQLIGRWFHDPHRAWNYWRDARLERRQMKRDVQDFHTLANVTADPTHPEMDEHALVKAENLKGWEMERLAIGRRIADPNTRTQEGDHLRHEHLGQLLARAYMDDPVAAKHVAQGLMTTGAQQMTRPQGFLGPVGIPFMPQIAAGLAVFGVIGWGVAWERGARLDHVKDELKTARQNLETTQASLANYTEVLEQRDEHTEKERAEYNKQLEEARTVALKAQQAAAQAKKRAADAQAKIIASGGDVPLGDILRNLPQVGGDTTAATPASDSNP